MAPSITKLYDRWVRNWVSPWPESVSGLYRPNDHRLSAKLVPTFANRECHVVSVTDLYGRILGFLFRITILTSFVYVNLTVFTELFRLLCWEQGTIKRWWSWRKTRRDPRLVQSFISLDDQRRHLPLSLFCSQIARTFQHTLLLRRIHFSITSLEPLTGVLLSLIAKRKGAPKSPM
jgi:hypothetical protein